MAARSSGGGNGILDAFDKWFSSSIFRSDFGRQDPPPLPPRNGGELAKRGQMSWLDLAVFTAAFVGFSAGAVLVAVSVGGRSFEDSVQIAGGFTCLFTYGTLLFGAL